MDGKNEKTTPFRTLFFQAYNALDLRKSGLDFKNPVDRQTFAMIQERGSHFLKREDELRSSKTPP